MDLAALESSLDRFLAAARPESVHKDEPEDPEWKKLHRIMDAAEPKLRRGFLAAVARMQTSETRKAVEARIDAGDIEGAISAIPWDDAADEILNGQFMREWRSVFEKAGSVSAKLIENVEPFDFSVAENPRALEYMAEQGGRLVREITGESQRGLRLALGRIRREGLGLSDSSKLIMQHVGLTERLSNAVQSFVSQRIVQGASSFKAARDGELYAKRLMTYRANNIARTESQYAASAGQAAAWQEAVLNGNVDANVAVEVWLTADDELANECEICGPMNNQEVRLGDKFTTGTGEMVDGPPAHPSCRCSRALAPTGSRRR